MNKLVVVNTLSECATPDSRIRIKHPSKGVNPLTANLPYGRKTIQREKRLINKASQKNKIGVRLNCGCYGKLQGNEYVMTSVCLLHAHSNVKDVATIIDYTIVGNLGHIDYRTEEDSQYGYVISKQGCNGLAIPLDMIGQKNERKYKIKKASPKKKATFLIKK